MSLMRSWPAVVLLATFGWHSHQPCTSLPQGIGGINRAHPRPPLSPQPSHQRAFSPHPLSIKATVIPAANGRATSYLRPKHATTGNSGNPSLGGLKPKLATWTGETEVEATVGGGNTPGPVGRVSLWLDMRTALLPALQTLRVLYDELRGHEEALGRNPDDPDSSLRRVPDPVGALLYASEPEGRAAREYQQLGGALPCYRVAAADGDCMKVFDVPGGNVVGVALDPVSGISGEHMGASAATEVVAAAQRAKESMVLLDSVRPSAWVDGDVATVVRIAASACAGSGKALVISVRSVGQLHDAAMAALAASQTQILGQAIDCDIVLLIEPAAALWEAGLLYL